MQCPQKNKMRRVALTLLGLGLSFFPLRSCYNGRLTQGIQVEDKVTELAPEKKGWAPHLIDWEITPNLLLGKIDLRGNTLLRLVDGAYSSRDIYLLRPVADRFEDMCREALKSGIRLQVISGTRTFYQQRYIWERKWESLFAKNSDKERAQHILRFSSMPMTSRHHWGTEVDINSIENAYFDTPEGRRVYEWLLEHAHRFGFVQVYGDKTNGRKGYEQEPWHWSYLPIASQYLDAYNKQITTDSITGFVGSETAQELNVIDDYVNSIDTISISRLRSTLL